MSDYIKVPKSELRKLEKSREKLYAFVEKCVNKGMLEKNSIEFIPELLEISDRIWRVANIKNWYHLNATDSMKKSNGSVKELEIKLKVNVFGDVFIENDRLFWIFRHQIPSLLFTKYPEEYYEILECELVDDN